MEWHSFHISRSTNHWMTSHNQWFNNDTPPQPDPYDSRHQRRSCQHPHPHPSRPLSNIYQHPTLTKSLPLNQESQWLEQDAPNPHAPKLASTKQQMKRFYQSQKWHPSRQKPGMCPITWLSLDSSQQSSPFAETTVSHHLVQYQPQTR